MFYLSHFFKLFKFYPLRSIGFFFLSFSLFFTLAFQNQVSSKIEGFVQGESKNAYFHALVAGRENHSRISRNLMNLPGVAQVEILSEDLIKDQVKEIIGSISVDIPESLFQLNYAGLKIVFAEGLKENSQNLIRDYLNRLVGDSQVTMSAVKQVEKTKRAGFWQQTVERYGFWMLWFGLLSFWVGVTVFFIQGLRRQAYLIEQFQRRRHVGAKIFISGQTVLMLVFIALCLMLTQWNWATVGLIALGYAPALTTMRKFSWH